MSRKFRAIVEELPSAGPKRFIGVKVPVHSISADLFVMRSILGARSEFYEKCHRARYAGEYHVTLINSIEYKKICAVQAEMVVGREAEINLIGLGRASDLLHDTFYVICLSEDMKILRGSLVSELQHFHVTLGFDGVDLHGVDKGVDTLIDFP